MSFKKNFSSGRRRDDKPKRAFSGKKSFGDKPAFKKRSNDSGFTKDGGDRRSYRPDSSSGSSRPDDRERKPFRRSADAKPFNDRNHSKPERRPDDDTRAPRAPFSSDSRPDDRERRPFRRPEGNAARAGGDDRRRDGSKPVRSSMNPKWEGRPDWKKENDSRAPRATDSWRSRPDDREHKPFRKPENKFDDDTRPKREERPERKPGDDSRPSRAPYSRDSRNENSERKPFRRAENNPAREGDDRIKRRRRDDSGPPSESRERKFADDRRSTMAPFPGDSHAGEGEKKWNRKSDSEFYGDKRKSAPRGRSFDKISDRRRSPLPGGEAGGDASDGLIRLNKFISNAGICSRREADEMIEAGVISVNGVVMTQLGYKVKPEDVVNYGGQTLRSEKMVYILLNKPKDFITTADDPEKRKTVMGLITHACKERVYPVGRLDRNTTGLLIMTNDGDLTRKLTHPGFEVQKIYQVELDKPFTSADMEAIEKGIHLDDGFIKPDSIDYVGTAQDKSVLGIELHSGKNRVVRRIFEHLGYDVKKLDRVYFAGLSKKDLPRGRWRFLTDMEVASLKIMTGSKKFKNIAPVEEDEGLE